jgi:hypothetical protein
VLFIPASFTAHIHGALQGERQTWAVEDFYADMPKPIRESPVAAKRQKSFADAPCALGKAVHPLISVVPFSEFTAVKSDANVSRLASLR